MNDQSILSDARIEAMLARRAGRGSPGGLAGAIEAALAETGQSHLPLWSYLLAPSRQAPTLRLVWVVAVVGLLLAAAVSVALVGGELLRRSSELTTTLPSAEPAPVATPSAAPADETGPAATRPIDQVNALEFAPDGSAWLATNGGVVHWDEAAGTARVYGQADGLPGTSAFRLAVSRDGAVWVAGTAWLARFDGRWTAYAQPDDLAGVEIQDIGAMTLDADGTLWVAAATTGGARLLRIDDLVQTITVPEMVAGHGSPWAHRLVAAPDGSIWASVFAGGATFVAVLDGSSWRTYRKGDGGLPRGPSLAGVTLQGMVWVELEAEGCVATTPVTCTAPAAGVASYDGSSWTVYTTAEGLPDNEVDLTVGPDGSVWAAHGSNVARFDGSAWVGSEVPALVDARPISVADDGTLWLTSSTGLLRYDGREATRPAIPAIAPPIEVPALVLEPLSADEPVVTPSALGRITWRLYQQSPQHSMWGATGTPSGPVWIDGPDLRWLTAAGAWVGASLPISPSRVTAVGNGIVAHGQGAVRLSWDGGRWVVGESLDTGLSFVEQVVLGPRGAVATGGTAIEHSLDGVHFDPAARGPDKATLAEERTDFEAPVGCSLVLGGGPGEGSIGPVLATDDGFLALTPAHPTNWNNGPLCEPVLWFSADGSTWDLVSAVSPFGDDATVEAVASRNGRHVAIGQVGPLTDKQNPGTWVVWVSDDGLRWERLPTLERTEPCGTIDGQPLCLDLLASVTASEAGWLIVGWDGAAWTSVDGRAWEPLRGWPSIRGGYMAPAVALSPDAVVVAGSLPGPWKDAIAIGTIER